MDAWAVCDISSVQTILCVRNKVSYVGKNRLRMLLITNLLLVKHSFCVTCQRISREKPEESLSPCVICNTLLYTCK